MTILLIILVTTLLLLSSQRHSSSLIQIVESHGMQYHVRPGKRILQYHDTDSRYQYTSTTTSTTTTTSRDLAREKSTKNNKEIDVFTIRNYGNNNKNTERTGTGNSKHNDKVAMNRTELWIISEKTFLSTMNNNNNNNNNKTNINGNRTNNEFMNINNYTSTSTSSSSSKSINLNPLKIDESSLGITSNLETVSSVTVNVNENASSLPVSNLTSPKLSKIIPTTASPAYEIKNNETTSKNNETMNNSINNDTNLYKPIRIKTIVTSESGNGKYLSQNERTILFEMISIAINAWHESLMVIPLMDNLTIDREQLYDGVSCGPGIDTDLPSPIVPHEHFNEGVEDTDLIIYLSLGFSSSDDDDDDDNHGEYNNINNETTTTLNNNYTNVINTTRIKNETTTNSNSIPKKIKLPKCKIVDDSIFASATYCSTDQYDRPIAGELYICVDAQDTFHPKQRQPNILSIMHEIGHILGMNPISLAYFRNNTDIDGLNGKNSSMLVPLTPRNDYDQSIPEVEVQCISSTYDIILNNNTTTNITNIRTMRLPLPSSSIIDIKYINNDSSIIESINVITPTVKRITSNHFNCHDEKLLSGAKLNTVLENECIGSHWDRKLFKNDLLNPILNDDDYIDNAIKLEYNFTSYKHFLSPLVLAYFIDSGWYMINDVHSIGPKSNIWGRDSGCSFVNEPCLDTNGNITTSSTKTNSNEFCSIDGELGCTEDISSKAICQLNHEHALKKYGNKSGYDPFLDYCPIYIKYENGLCNNPSNEHALRVHSIEGFTINSRCIKGHYYNNKNDNRVNVVPLCLPIACVISDQSLRIKVNGNWNHTCHYAGQQIEETTTTNKKEAFYKGWIECPDPVKVCPTFYCPYDCLDTTNGICDYDTGLCMCPNPFSSLDLVNNTISHFDDNYTAYDWLYNIPYEQEQQQQELIDCNLLKYLLVNNKTSSSSASSKKGNINKVLDLEQSSSSYHHQSEVDFFETKLSQHYVINAELLENDPPISTQDTKPSNNNKEYPIWTFYVGVFVVISTFAIIIMSYVRIKKKLRERNKQKFVASLLVDMRVHGSSTSNNIQNSINNSSRRKESSKISASMSKHKKKKRYYYYYSNKHRKLIRQRLKQRMNNNVTTHIRNNTSSSSTTSYDDGESDNSFNGSFTTEVKKDEENIGSFQSSLFSEENDEENNFINFEGQSGRLDSLNENTFL